VFHLAGVLPGSPGGPAIQYEAHLMTTIRLLEAVRKTRADCRVLIASSSAVYGPTTSEDPPLTEEWPFRPLTHYAASKVAQEMTALHYALAYKMWTVRVRTFNLVGPGQPSGLLASDLAHRIALAERGGSPTTLRVGNLFPRRDYTDVRDAARAYVLLAMGARPGEVYNVCSGRSYSVRECAELLMQMASVPLTLAADATLVRDVEIADQRGAFDSIRAVVGWQPGLSLEASLRDLLEDWRARVHREG